MKELILEASDDKLEEAQEFVRELLESEECSPGFIISIEIAIEEIFVNISHYAYEGLDGVERQALIRCDISGEPKKLYMEFQDWGIPFDPLKKPDADITLSAEERQIGGLGIFMVKNTMDTMDYKYEDKKNILSMTKTL